MKNEGIIDRIIRAVGGMVLLFLGYFCFSGPYCVALYILGGFMILTAITGFCALYRFLDISTLKK
jgi:hypothetical protein